MTFALSRKRRGLCAEQWRFPLARQGAGTVPMPERPGPGSRRFRPRFFDVVTHSGRLGYVEVHARGLDPMRAFGLAVLPRRHHPSRRRVSEGAGSRLDMRQVEEIACKNTCTGLVAPPYSYTYSYTPISHLSHAHFHLAAWRRRRGSCRHRHLHSFSAPSAPPRDTLPSVPPAPPRAASPREATDFFSLPPPTRIPQSAFRISSRPASPLKSPATRRSPSMAHFTGAIKSEQFQSGAGAVRRRIQTVLRCAQRENDPKSFRKRMKKGAK
jgi:hypothetical protein